MAQKTITINKVSRPVLKRGDVCKCVELFDEIVSEEERLQYADKRESALWVYDTKRNSKHDQLMAFRMYIENEPYDPELPIALIWCMDYRDNEAAVGIEVVGELTLPKEDPYFRDHR